MFLIHYFDYQIRESFLSKKTPNKVNEAVDNTKYMLKRRVVSRFLAWTFQTESQQRNWKYENIF